MPPFLSELSKPFEMSKATETYSPEWISSEDAAKWLGVEVNTLILWRKTKGLAWTTMGGGKTVMYDRKQITELLNKNSTYAITGNKKLTA